VISLGWITGQAQDEIGLDRPGQIHRARCAASTTAGAVRTTAGAVRTTAGAVRTTAGSVRLAAGAIRTFEDTISATTGLVGTTHGPAAVRLLAATEPSSRGRPQVRHAGPEELTQQDVRRDGERGGRPPGGRPPVGRQFRGDAHVAADYAIPANYV
jgi:hypothetical protein